MKNNEEKNLKKLKDDKKGGEEKKKYKKIGKKIIKSLKEFKLNSDYIKYKWIKCLGKRERFEFGFKVI